MKFFIRFFLIVLIAGCGSKTTNSTTEQPDSVIKEDNATVIVFKDTYISGYMKEYDNFIENYISNLKNPNRVKTKQLEKQSIELVEKAKIVSSKLKTRAQIEKFNKWLDAQNKKIASLPQK